MPTFSACSEKISPLDMALDQLKAEMLAVDVWHKEKISKVYSWDLDSRKSALAWSENSKILHDNIDVICKRLNDSTISADDVQKFRKYILDVESLMRNCENNLLDNFKIRMLDICTLALIACSMATTHINVIDTEMAMTHVEKISPLDRALRQLNLGMNDYRVSY
jgi:hypothetical protein